MNNSVCIESALTVVIVSYNSFKSIDEFLGGLLEESVCRVIVVDNASSDDTAALIKDRYSRVELVELEVNVGYGRAANVAFDLIKTEFALLLNPDVRVDRKNLVAIFDEVVSDDSKAAVYAPALNKKTFLKEGNVNVDYLVGAFLLFRMNCLYENGFFDENIFLFYEEKDLELRLIKNGYGVMLLSDHYVEHSGSSSTEPSQFVSNFRNWHVAWSSLYFFYKHGMMKKRYEGLILMYRYAIKSIVNRNRLKRLKYKARYQGCKAYLSGEGAFNEDGLPRMPDAI